MSTFKPAVVRSRHYVCRIGRRDTVGIAVQSAIRIGHHRKMDDMSERGEINVGCRHGRLLPSRVVARPPKISLRREGKQRKCANQQQRSRLEWKPP